MRVQFAHSDGLVSRCTESWDGDSSSRLARVPVRWPLSMTQILSVQHIWDQPQCRIRIPTCTDLSRLPSWPAFFGECVSTLHLFPMSDFALWVFPNEQHVLAGQPGHLLFVPDWLVDHLQFLPPGHVVQEGWLNPRCFHRATRKYPGWLCLWLRFHRRCMRAIGLLVSSLTRWAFFHAGCLGCRPSRIHQGLLCSTGSA